MPQSVGAIQRLVAGGRMVSMLRQRTSTLPGFGIAVAILLLCLVFSFTTENFLTPDNLLNVARQSSLVGLMSIGLTFVLVSGQIDLSMGSVYALAGVVAAIVMTATESVILGVAAGLGVGIVAGGTNGLLAAYFGLPSFIVTLGTLSIMRGLVLSITDGQAQSLLDLNAAGLDAFFFLGRGEILGVPSQFVLLLGVMVVATFILRLTPFGLRIYAAGGSREAADLAGAKVVRLQVSTFVISGVLAAAGGVIALGFLGSIAPTAAQGIEFDVFAAAVLGGASLFGGLGTATGAMLGALFLGVLRNGLLLLDVSSFNQGIIIGVITIAAVGLNRLAVGRGSGA